MLEKVRRMECLISTQHSLLLSLLTPTKSDERTGDVGPKELTRKCCYKSLLEAETAVSSDHCLPACRPFKDSMFDIKTLVCPLLRTPFRQRRRNILTIAVRIVFADRPSVSSGRRFKVKL